LNFTVLGLGNRCFSASFDIVCKDDALAHCVEIFNRSVFEDVTFLPKADLKARPLFGYKSYLGSDDPQHHREYQYSCRLIVDLLKADLGRDFEEARDGLSAFVLGLLRSKLADGAPTQIKAMSLLLQVPLSGECQVWHTDEDQEDAEVVYSVLIPCHRQSAPVFLDGLDAKTGPTGVKPVLSLGDMVYWVASLVTHAGSSADKVPPGQFLRAAVFMSVGMPSRKDDSTSAVIHSGPDVDQWTKCVHPIIRTCVRCRRGVQACEPNMKYCPTCLGSGAFQATAVLCQWCHDSDDHLHVQLKVPVPKRTNLLRYLWQGLGLAPTAVERRLCIHGNAAFQDMSSSQRLLLHFHEGELRRGFTFWSQFFLHFAPEQTIFKDGQRAALSEHELWKIFYGKFVQSKRRKQRCSRSLRILGVTSMICGFSSLVCRDNTSIPVFLAVDMFQTHYAAYVEAYLVAKSNKDRLMLSHDDRIGRALSWLESEGGTTHCSCGCSDESLAESLSKHHRIQECPGPIFVQPNVVPAQSSDVRAVWINVFISQVGEKGMHFVFVPWISYFVFSVYDAILNG
jgi:hypothetical protein